MHLCTLMNSQIWIIFSNELLIKCLPPQLFAKRAWVCLLMQIIAILVKSNLSGDPVPKQL